MKMHEQLNAWERAFAARGYTHFTALPLIGVARSCWGKWSRGECGCTMKTAAKIDAWLDKTPLVKDASDAAS